MLKKPLSPRDRGWGEGTAEAGNAGADGQGKVSLLTVAEDFTCLRRTLIRPFGAPSPEGRRENLHGALALAVS